MLGFSASVSLEIAKRFPELNSQQSGHSENILDRTFDRLVNKLLLTLLSCTANPTGEWTTQQARNFQMHLLDEELPCELLQRDQDTKYVDSFDDVFRSTGCQIKKTCPRSPNLQAFVERVIQTLKHEVLNAFCVVSETHMDHILRVSQDWYNHRRGHSARGNLPPIRETDSPPTTDLKTTKIECHKELGGLLKSYRAAA